MHKFGLDYESLREVRRDIIYCEFYSYGPGGPLSHIGANDLALQAHSGMMSITGEPDRPPVRCGTSIVDLHASLALVTAILAALFHRERTGEGQAVATSLLQSSAHLMNYFYGEYWALGVIRGRMGTANHLSVPNQVFPAADGSVVIIAPNDEMWKRTAAALDPALDRPEWRTMVDRQQHRAAIIDAISAVTRTLKSEELVKRLGDAKVNVAKVNDIGEAADHPQLAAIGGVLELPLQSGGTMKAAASPFSLRGAPTAPDRAPPRLAADKDAILADLGFAPDEVDALEREGAFGDTTSRAAR
jgi:crotonobetainyl-CoA:carnitine CoA-transferase CaiB-like acyl-CoA transferase